MFEYIENNAATLQASFAAEIASQLDPMLTNARCRWPPHPVSSHRDLDLTHCFEHTILLPVPLILTILVAAIQIGSKYRRLQRPVAEGGLKWTIHNPSSERACRAKTILLSLSAVLSLASLIISLVQFNLSPYSALHYGLFTLTLLALIHLTTLNHHTSRISSTLVLIFWPIYTIISVVRIRTMIITGELSSRLNQTPDGRLILARESIWIGILALGFADFMLELYSPEKRFKKWRAPWNRKGKITLDEETDSEDGAAIDEEKPYDEIESPVLVANIYERLSFSWLTPLLSLGTRKFLGEEDMWALPPQDSAESLSNRLSETWQAQVQAVKAGKKSKPSLTMAIARAYGGPYLVAGLLKAAYDSLNFLQPQLLRLLLSYVSSYGTPEPMPPVAGFAISILMFITSNVAVAMLHQYFDRCFSTSKSHS